MVSRCVAVLALMAACRQPMDSPEPPPAKPGPVAEAWNELLGRVVNDEGFVDYDTLEAERQTLDRYVAWLGKSRRPPRSAQRHAQACAAFASPDQAQIDFLARGGPERDRKGLDPDGDGFACSWNPAPFRKARAAAQPAATPAPGVAAQPNISTEG